MQMQKLVKEPSSVSLSAPRQLEPITQTLKHQPSAASLTSPIQTRNGTPAPRDLRRGSSLSRGESDGTVSPGKRLSIAQRKRSTVRRASTRMGLTAMGGSRRSISPSRRKSSRNVRFHDGDKNQQSGGEEGNGNGEGDDLDDDDEEEDDDDGDGREDENIFDARRAERMYKDTQATSIYHDGGTTYRGVIDRRGITPFVTFTSTETPPSQSKNRLLLDRKQTPPSCGFCSSTNLIWMLRCSFCGCSRMSDAPRLKYLIDMVLSVNPTVSGHELAKRVLDFATFDHVAMKVEEKFKQASLVRAKAAIMMMSRTIRVLRMQTMRMIFTAWRGNNALQASHDLIMHRLIKIKDIQVKTKSKKMVFTMWKGYVDRIVEERSQRFAIASKRNDATKLRRMWSAWQTFLRRRAKEKLHELKLQHEAERNEAPSVYVREIERLKESLAESRRLVFAATNTMFDLLHESSRFADDDVQKALQIKEMYPTTAGVFFESVYGMKILQGLGDGHVSASDDFATDDAAMEQLIANGLVDAKTTLDRMHSSESLIQWLNFQRKRATNMTFQAITSSSSSSSSSTPSGTTHAAAIGGGASTASLSSSMSEPTSSRSTVSSSSSSPSKRPSVKLKPVGKDKNKKDHKEITGLQDLRVSIGSPGMLLKLLCHSSQDARSEYHRFRATESANAAASVASVAAETSTTTTALTASAQVQLRAYFKMVTRFLKLPPDVVTKDAFILNDFDSLYAYAVYLYTFHTNTIAPGLALSPRYHLQFDFFTPQWHKIQQKLTDDAFDPFAQQQFYIFLAKIKRVNKQFVRFEAICRAMNTIAQWHQLETLKDTYNDLSRRAHGKDSNISVALEKETLAAWVSLPAAKLLCLCDNNEDELLEIEKVFKENVLDLVKLFRIYGSGSGGKGILEQEFLKVMTKSGVTDKKNILRSNLQVIYQQSRASGGIPVGTAVDSSSSTTNTNPGTATSSSSSANNPNSTTNNSNTSSGGTTTTTDDTDDDNTISEDRGATPNEFFEALVRVAYHNSQKRRINEMTNLASSSAPMASASPTTTTTPLLAHVIELVVDKVVPLTKKFQEQGLMFKKQMVQPEVQTVCKAQEKKLKRVFLTYSQKNKNPGSRGKLMDLLDFETLLKDKRLVDALFPHGKIKQLVAFVQQDGDLTSLSGGGGGGGFDSDGTEFVFAEFVEALAAIAVFRNANPYLPLAKKLDVFLDENF